MDLLRTPKRLYYRWTNGEEMNANELTDIIEKSIYDAYELKIVYQKQKIDLSWSEYKKIIEDFLINIFNRCRLIEDYEIENLTNEQMNTTNKYIYDFYNEDKSYIKYICDSLEGEMLKWQKKYYGVRDHKQYKRCKECGALIEIRSKKDYSTKYCEVCKKEIIKKQTNERVKKYRSKNVTQAKFVYTT